MRRDGDSGLRRLRTLMRGYDYAESKAMKPSLPAMNERKVQ